MVVELELALIERKQSRQGRVCVCVHSSVLLGLPLGATIEPKKSNFQIQTCKAKGISKIDSLFTVTTYTSSWYTKRSILKFTQSHGQLSWLAVQMMEFSCCTGSVISVIYK